jgi:hypothetical protein
MKRNALPNEMHRKASWCRESQLLSGSSNTDIFGLLYVEKLLVASEFRQVIEYI